MANWPHFYYFQLKCSFLRFSNLISVGPQILHTVTKVLLGNFLTKHTCSADLKYFLWIRAVLHIRSKRLFYSSLYIAGWRRRTAFFRTAPAATPIYIYIYIYRERERERERERSHREIFLFESLFSLNFIKGVAVNPPYQLLPAICRIRVLFGVCDLIAKAPVTAMKQFNGQFGCKWMYKTYYRSLDLSDILYEDRTCIGGKNVPCGFMN